MNKIKLGNFADKLMLASNKEYVENLFGVTNDKREKLTDDKRKEAIIAASKKRDNAIAFAGAREEVVTSRLWADNLALSFFKLQNIADDEWPQIVNVDDQSYSILKTSVHGEAPVDEFARANDTLMLQPYQLSSGIIKYPILSAMTGKLDVSEKVNKDLARSTEQNLNTDLYALIDAAIGSFPAGTITADSRIVSGTLPTTNSLSVTGDSAFSFAVLKAIISHLMRLGLDLKFLTMNPSQVDDLWDWQHLVSTTSSGSQDGRSMITTRVKDEILQSGKIGQMLGQEFTILLDPTRPLNYVDFYSSQPVGTLYDKPGIADVMHFDKIWMKGAGYGNNYEGVEMNRWLVPAIHATQRKNFGLCQFA